MKKHLFSLFALVLICLTNVSCEKGGTSSNSLVGAWICEKEEATMADGNFYTHTKESDMKIFAKRMYFTSDGFISFDDESFPVEYSVKNNIIVVLGMQYYKIVSNNGSKLVLEATEARLSIDNMMQEELFHEPNFVKVVATYKKQ